MPSRPRPTHLSNVPDHVLLAHVLRRLPDRNLKSVAATSRAMRANAKPLLLGRRDAREGELRDLAKALSSALDRSKHKGPLSPGIFKEHIDNLPRGQFRVARSRLQNDVNELDVRTPTFMASMYVAWLDDGTIFSSGLLIQARGSRVARATMQLDYDGRRYTRKLSPGFPAEWAKIVERAMFDVRRSPRRRRRARSGSYVS